MTDTNIVLGIDIGGTNTAFGLVDVNGKCLFTDTVSTQSHQPAKDLFDRIFNHTYTWLAESHVKYDIMGIGVGAPNANYYSGNIENAPNLGWGDVEVVSILKQHMSVPAFITNDANAAAIGEMQFGAAKGMKNFIEITLGTGLGSGIVVNGELVYGHDGHAGEMGHTLVIPGGRLCNCGRQGCLETYSSATGIRQTVIDLLSTSQANGYLDRLANEDISSKNIYEAALQGDEIATEAFRQTAEILGRAMADAAAYFSPEAFIFFGGLAEAGDVLYKPLKKYFEKYLMAGYKNKIKILPSGLKPGQAAILGAAALIWHKLNH